MQLFCNFSFILFFQKGRAFARISLFERSERDLLFFSFLYFPFLYFPFLYFVYLNAVFGEFFPTKPGFWRNLLFDLLLFLMVEKALVFVCIDI